MNEVLSIIDLSRTDLEAAKGKVKKMSKISYGQCKRVILESLVPMSPERRTLFGLLALKISKEEIMPNLKDLLEILAMHPQSFAVISSILAGIKKIDYLNVETCLKASLKLKDLKLIYFCINLTFKCPPKVVSKHLPDLVQTINTDPRLTEAVRAILKTIPATYLPDEENLHILLKQANDEKGREIIRLLSKRKKLGDAKFLADGFATTFSFPKGELPEVIVHGEKIKIHFSHHLVNYCNINFQDIIMSPVGPAIVAGYKHGSLIIAPIGESEACYMDGLALIDFEKCGIRKIGRIR